MKYLVMLIGEGEMTPWASLSDEEQAAAMQKFEDFDAVCRDRDGVEILAGEALSERPSDTTMMRTRGGEVALTEGPYAEALEGLGGFYLMEVPDLDVLVDVLGALPDYDMQITPVIDPY